MAHWAADETGGDLYRVTAKDPYPTDYNQTADRAKSEQDNDVRPEIVIDITEEQMAQMRRSKSLMACLTASGLAQAPLRKAGSTAPWSSGNAI